MHRGYTCLWRKIWSNPVLAEPNKPFLRLQAWLYITNVLAVPMDDEAAGLKRGEFVASIRQLAACFHWSRGAVRRFLETLLQNSMTMRVGRKTIPPAEQEAAHFSVCNYETYNPPRHTGRYPEGLAAQEAAYLIAGNCDTYGLPRHTGRDTERQGVCIYTNINNNVNNKDTHNTHDAQNPAVKDACVSPRILHEIYKQHNRVLSSVRALTADRLRKCRSRINQAVRDGCLEQYLADFVAAVKKAQSTPFLRGEGARGWRANFDWFVTNHRNVYAVLEGKYDGPASGPNNRQGASHGNDYGQIDGDGSRAAGVTRRTSRGDPIYIPRQ